MHKFELRARENEIINGQKNEWYLWPDKGASMEGVVWREPLRIVLAFLSHSIFRDKNRSDWNTIWNRGEFI